MLPDGTVLDDRFVVGDLLGEGGMGRVHRALDRTTGESVAVKILLDAEPGSSEAARFESEIRLLGELAHPGIVSYIAHGKTPDGSAYLVMEELHGEDLAARLLRGPLDVPGCLVLVEQVARALYEAHRRRIVHRDLKPSNLFLRGGELTRVALLDFGVARRAGATRLTRTGGVVGTPDYMAPEQVQSSREVGPAADVFALGCVLYECLAGVPPFASEHPMTTLGRIVFEEPLPLAELRPGVPGTLLALVDRMLEKAAARRPADAGALLDALEELGPLDTSAVALPVRGLGGPRAAVTAETFAAAATLQGGVPSVEPARLLLGKPTPCVGRDHELMTLESSLVSSFDDGAARAVLVVAPAGLGKSRLRYELLKRVEARSPAPVLGLEAYAELLRDGSPYGLVANALRRAFGIAAGDSDEVARDKVLAGVTRWLPAAEARPVAELLGEVCDAPFPDEQSVRLRAARQDPRLMQERVGEAFVALLGAAAERGGVLVVLEDLHRGDHASMDLVERALRELEELPLFVVAFARPEIHELAPGLWKGRVLELPLRPLARRTAERLVRAVAGDRLDDAVIARIVERAGGNVLFLEELIRSACTGGPDTLPGTVLAMLQARIARLATGEQHVLRAASVFGESFEPEGVRAVLGPTARPDDVARRLEDLVREEVVEPRRKRSGSYRFRHELMREAAYDLLAPGDRQLGHQLAAEWLAGREHDPAPVAEHFLLAGEPDQAAPWFVKAAQRAYDRDDYTTCERLARRGRERAARGGLAGALASLEAFSALMRWDWPAGGAAAEDALALAEPGSKYWCYAERVAAQLAGYRNDADDLCAHVERVLSTDPLPDARLVYVDAVLHIASGATQVGLPRLGRRLLDRAEQDFPVELARYPSLRAWLDMIRCTHLRHTSDRLAPQVAWLREALRLYDEVGGSGTMRILARDVLGEALCRSGALAEGEAVLRESLADAGLLGVRFLLSHARLALANGLVAQSEPAAKQEAGKHAGELLDTPGISAGYEAMARDVLAQVQLASGDAAGAEENARKAIELSPHTPVRRWLMVAHLCQALVAQQRAADGLAEAERALGEVDEAGGGGYGELSLLSAAVEAARAAGEPNRADAVVRRTRDYCAEQAAAFSGADARARYLAHVPAWARGEA